MATLDTLLSALDERRVAREIGIPHDEARMRYPLRSNTVRDFHAFSDIIGDYVRHHYAACISRGGTLSRAEAVGRAKEILDREYRRSGGDMMSAFGNAAEGVEGGLRAVLDKLAEAIKVEAVERYTREVFDRLVAPNDWERKVELIRQFIRHLGYQFGGAIQADRPERYAHDYRELIRGYVDGMRRTSSIFRRL